MDRVFPTFIFSCTCPWIEDAGKPLRVFDTDVEERFAKVEDALEAKTERADFAGILLLRPSDGPMQRLVILGRERTIVSHKQRRTM